MTTKPTNPKDALGIRKVPMSTVPAPVIAELGVAMFEGALKYGRHNYRIVGVRASVYYDAVMARHLPAWWEGEDIDVDSDLSHITKAIASLVVLRDAMIRGNWIDDRPPRTAPGWQDSLNAHVAKLIAKYPDPVPPYIHSDKPAPAPRPVPIVCGFNSTHHDGAPCVTCGAVWEEADSRPAVCQHRLNRKNAA